jgi:serine/threonine-protein kinase RsbW
MIPTCRMSRLESAPVPDVPGCPPGVTAGDWTRAFTMTIPADPGAISAMVDGVTRELEARKWRDDDLASVQLAVTEAVANAIRHGCRGDVTRNVECSVGCPDTDEVVIVVRDPGVGFDPDGVPDPRDPVNTFKPSGRGIFLMRRLMDHVVFADGGRVVQMRKRRTLEREAGGAGSTEMSA